MAALSKLVERFRKNIAGSLAVGLGLGMPVLMCCGGIAMDYANYNLMQARFQAAIDSAVVAGANEFSVAGFSEEQIKGAVSTYIDNENLQDYGPVTVTAEVDSEGKHVTGTLAVAWTPFISSFLDVGLTPIVVDARAGMVSESYNVCVLALKKSGVGGIVSSQSAKLTAEDCGVFANSTSAQAIAAKNSTVVNAGGIFTAGGYVRDAGAVVTPEPVTDTATVNDPLANRAEPSIGTCDHSKFALSTGAHTIEPGVYCGGITVSGDARVTFAPGLFILKDGPLQLRGNSVSTGSDVGFYFNGTLSIIAFYENASVSLSGPKTGNMAGILFFGQRTAELTKIHIIRSSLVNKLEGTIYLPTGSLLVNPNATVAANSDYTAIIVYQLWLADSPTLVINSDYDQSDVPVPEGIVRSGSVVLTQ
jgi:Putative Flp pilus-assembly TadE/G-like